MLKIWLMEERNKKAEALEQKQKQKTQKKKKCFTVLNIITAANTKINK